MSSGMTAVVSSDTLAYLSEAARLLGFGEGELTNALTTRTISARGEVMIKPLDAVHAGDTRDAFVKEIYGRLFSQIVAHANKSLAFSDIEKGSSAKTGPGGSRRVSVQGVVVSIGLLDIFGFEIFTSNSFEQLW
jgi:myosin heavy subunit